MEAYDSVWLMADAMERAGSLPRSRCHRRRAGDGRYRPCRKGHYYFTYGSHNPVILPEGTPAYMWHQWPVPVVTVMQYFEQGQSGLDAAVVYPEVYQTHGTVILQTGRIAVNQYHICRASCVFTYLDVAPAFSSAQRMF